MTDNMDSLLLGYCDKLKNKERENRNDQERSI